MLLKSTLGALATVAVTFGGTALSAERRQCGHRELKDKSCLIKSWTYTIKLTKDKIILNNKVWRSLETFPFIGELTSWDSVFVAQVGVRKFLSLKIWDAPEGEADIQALYWILYELKNGKIYLKVQHELQKRRWAGDKPVKLMDRRWRTQLKQGKAGAVIWSVGNQKGEF